MPAKQYKASLQMGDKEFKSAAESLPEALEKMKVDRFFKAKGILRVAFGDKTAERLMTIPQMKRVFFGGRLNREVFSKQLSIFLR